MAKSKKDVTDYTRQNVIVICEDGEERIGLFVRGELKIGEGCIIHIYTAQKSRIQPPIVSVYNGIIKKIL